MLVRNRQTRGSSSASSVARGTGLRVIAGSLKGRRLEAPGWAGLRPSSDRLRETLFNILGSSVAGARVLDGYAGTGAVGIEALSRGATHVTFVDRDARALELVARNLARCGVSEGYAIIRADLGAVGRRPLSATFDLVFLDPPYDANPSEAMEQIDPALAPDGLLVLEHARRSSAPLRAGPLERVREVTSGGAALGFYRRRAGGEGPEAAA